MLGMKDGEASVRSDHHLDGLVTLTTPHEDSLPVLLVVGRDVGRPSVTRKGKQKGFGAGLEPKLASARRATVVHLHLTGLGVVIREQVVHPATDGQKTGSEITAEATFGQALPLGSATLEGFQRRRQLLRSEFAS